MLSNWRKYWMPTKKSNKNFFEIAPMTQNRLWKMGDPRVPDGWLPEHIRNRQAIKTQIFTYEDGIVVIVKLYKI